MALLVHNAWSVWSALHNCFSLHFQPDSPNAQCPCKAGFTGQYCDKCAPVSHLFPEFTQKPPQGFTNITAGCTACKCDEAGSMSEECDLETGQCQCKSSFGGLQCEKCAKGYFRLKETNGRTFWTKSFTKLWHPFNAFAECVYCDCDPSGTEDEVCDGQNGQCLCKPGFAGRRCDRCDDAFFGYPACRECLCHDRGSKTSQCDPVTGEW